MKRYLVHTVIVLKGIRDPEGETILRDLVLAGGFNNVDRVISGKYLGFVVNATGVKEAIKYVRDLCERMRIYNPTVHELMVLGVEDAKGGRD